MIPFTTRYDKLYCVKLALIISGSNFRLSGKYTNPGLNKAEPTLDQLVSRIVRTKK